MRSIEARIGRLEAALAPDPDDPYGLRDQTNDELTIGLLDIERLIVADANATEMERSEAAAEIDQIEDEITRRAASVARGDYAEHWARERRNWATWYSGQGDYLPPLLGEMDGDWGIHENLMQRRAALRARPDIAALIEVGEMSVKNRIARLETGRDNEH